MPWQIWLSVCALAAIVHAQPADPVQTRLREYIHAQEDVNGFSGAILLVKNGELLVRAGVGACNRELSVPCTPQMKFRLGSITKTFTAAAIMLLAERGKLTVQDPIAKHLPYAPEAWKPVTIHHLLSHTSGIPNFTNDPSYGRQNHMPVSLPELIARFKDKPLEFTPGERWNYSNSGYVLLGDIIERVSGSKYEEFLQQEILDPLGMRDTGYDHWSTILPNRAAGYQRVGGRWTNADYIDMSWPQAAGALYSTVDDLRRWHEALLGDKLLPAAARERMFTSVKNNYGYGWAQTSFGQQKVIGHGGGIEGFSTFIGRIVEDGTLVVVLSNVQQAPSSRVAQQLTAIAYGQPVELPKRRQSISLRNEVFDKYVGKYELAPNFFLTISREGGRFLLQATGQAQVEMFPETETDFFLRAVDAQVTFVTDPAGKTHSLVLHQNGRDLKGKKVD